MADDAITKFQQQFELFFNQDRAELAAVKAILQSLLVSMVASNPRGAELLSLLKMAALSHFEKPLPIEAADQDQKRFRELIRNYIETFFEEFDLKSQEDAPKSRGTH